MKISHQQNYKVAALLSWIMIAGICFAALIPGIGFLTWIIGVPILLITFILGIIIISKGGTLHGVIILLMSLIFAPVFVVFAPIITTFVAVAATAEKHPTYCLNEPGEYQEYRSHNLGELGFEDQSLAIAIEKVKAALENADSGLTIMVSNEFIDFRDPITFPKENYTVESAATTLCSQTDGKWKIEEGKGILLTLSHPDDTSQTTFSSSLEHDFRANEPQESDKSDPFE